MPNELVLVTRIADVPVLTHPHSVKSVAFSPDGHVLASGDERGRISFWSAATGTELHSIADLSDRFFTTVHALAFAPDGKSLAAGVDNMVTILDPEGKAPPQPRARHTKPVKQVAFSRNAILSIGDDETIRRTPLPNGRSRILARLKRLVSLAVFPEGAFAVGCDDGRIHLYSEDGKSMRTLEGHQGTVKALAIAPSGQLASAAWDGIRLWDGAKSRLITGERSFGLSFTSEGHLMALMGSGLPLETLSTFALNGSEVRRLDVRHAIPSLGPGAIVNFCIAFSPDMQRVALTGHGHWIALIETASGTRLPPSVPNRPCEALAFSPDSAIIAAADDKDVRVCATQSGVELRRFTAPQTVYDLVFTPDGKRLIVRHAWGTQILDAQSGKELASLKDPSGSGGAAVSPDGGLVAVAGWSAWTLVLYTIAGEIVRIWDEPHGTHEESMQWSDDTHQEANGVTSVAFSADSKWLVSIGGWHISQDARVWDLGHESEQPIAVVDKADAAWFLADNSLVVSKYSGSRLVAIGEAKLRVLRTLPFALNSVSPNGRAAAATKILDLATGETIAEIAESARRGGISAIAFSADGQLLATAGEDGAVMVWRIP